MKTYWKIIAFSIVATLGCARSGVVMEPGKGEGALKPPPDRAQVAQGDKPAPGDKFEFPADKGGKLLGETLRPGQKAADDPAAEPAPKPLVAPLEIAQPAVALSTPPTDLPRPALKPKTPPLRPHVLAEDAPLSAYRADPAAVRTIHMPAGALVHVPTPDVNVAPWLPFQGVLGIDKGPLDDPTTDDSLKTALAAPPPIRSNPAPFLRLNLPDPFENGQVVRLRVQPPEDPTPTAGIVRVPK